jgi:hypothetical protein
LEPGRCPSKAYRLAVDNGRNVGGFVSALSGVLEHLYVDDPRAKPPSPPIGTADVAEARPGAEFSLTGRATLP